MEQEILEAIVLPLKKNSSLAVLDDAKKRLRIWYYCENLRMPYIFYVTSYMKITSILKMCLDKTKNFRFEN